MRRSFFILFFLYSQAAVPIDGLYKGQLTVDDLNQIQQLWKERIPTGFEMHSSPLPGAKSTLKDITDDVEPTAFLKDKLMLPKVSEQLGTLGGGYVGGLHSSFDLFSLDFSNNPFDIGITF